MMSVHDENKGKHQIMQQLVRQLLLKPDSKINFVFIMASCAYALNSLTARVITLFYHHAPSAFVNPLGVQRSLTSGIMDGLLGSPVLESLILAGIIELTNLFKVSYLWQLISSTVILCALHAPGFPARSIVVAPLFFICGYSYLRWKRESRKTGLLIIILIHSMTNVNSVLDFAIRKQMK